jgi:hypothetical protein
MGRWPEKPIDKPTKFEVVYKDDDGTESIWKYDLKKFPNGPIEVVNKFPAGYDKMMKKQQKEAKLEKKKSILEKAADAKKDGKKYW